MLALPRPVLLLLVLTPGVVTASTLEAGLELYRAQRYAEAQEVFERERESDPDNPVVYRYLAELASRRQDFAEASRWMEQAVARRPQDPYYHLLLGGYYGWHAQRAPLFRKRGWALKCLASLEKAVALDPDYLEARAALVEYYREAPSFVGGGRDKAHREASFIRERDARRGTLLQASLYEEEKRPAEALALCEAHLERVPDDYAVLYFLGRAAIDAGRAAERAAGALQRCLELPPPADAPGLAWVHFQLGRLHEQRGRPAEARSAYEAALALEADFPSARAARDRLAPAVADSRSSPAP